MVKSRGRCETDQNSRDIALHSITGHRAGRCPAPAETQPKRGTEAWPGISGSESSQMRARDFGGQGGTQESRREKTRDSGPRLLPEPEGQRITSYPELSWKTNFSRRIKVKAPYLENWAVSPRSFPLLQKPPRGKKLHFPSGLAAHRLRTLVTSL